MEGEYMTNKVEDYLESVFSDRRGSGLSERQTGDRRGDRPADIWNVGEMRKSRKLSFRGLVEQDFNI